jgi:CRISPR-associated exonuclease Cas4
MSEDEIGLDGEQDAARLPLSPLNHLVFCERRCALIHIEGVFVQNAFTVEGTLAHEAADLSGYEGKEGVRVLHAFPLWSGRLKLSGKADIVEFQPKHGFENAAPSRIQTGPPKSRAERRCPTLCASPVP